MTTEIRVLGPVEIITGTNIERPRGRQVALLAELVAAFPDPVSTGTHSTSSAAITGERNRTSAPPPPTHSVPQAAAGTWVR